MLRIINKQTGVFLRDDFTFEENMEVGLNIDPAQGFYSPKWDGEKWIEGLTEAEIDAIKANIETPQPSLEDKVAELQDVIAELTTILNDKGIAP